MPYLTGIVLVEDSEGERIDRPLADGTYQPIALALDASISGVSTQDGGPLTKVTLAVAGGFVPGSNMITAGPAILLNGSTAPVAIGDLTEIEVNKDVDANPDAAVGRDADGTIRNNRTGLFNGGGSPAFFIGSANACCYAEDVTPATGPTAEGTAYFGCKARVWDTGGSASVVTYFSFGLLPNGGTGTASWTIAGDLGDGLGQFISGDSVGNLSVPGYVHAGVVTLTGPGISLDSNGRVSFWTSTGGQQICPAIGEASGDGGSASSNFTFSKDKAIIIDTGGGAVVGQLPAASSVTSRHIVQAILSGGNPCTFTKANAGDTIYNGLSGVPVVSATDQLVTFMSDGALGWYPWFG